jgi:hypothetical protein
MYSNSALTTRESAILTFLSFGYRWLEREYAAGRRARPIMCDACGQADGPIDAHSEDYSAPFGDHIGDSNKLVADLHRRKSADRHFNRDMAW